MEISTDPYEQKLYHMFKSYDTESLGSLDRTALMKLCNTLELNDQGNFLVGSLITKSGSRVTFKQFKEALLNFLGTEMDDSTKSDKAHHINANEYVCSAPDSPGREISPKLIMGTKKYGRRSRPQSVVSDSSQSDSDNESIELITGLGKKTQKVQRSSSQSEIHATRRRRPNSSTKLKRCASLPAQQNPKAKELLAKQQEDQQKQSSLQQNQLTSSVESLGNLDFENLSHTLYEVWTNYGNELGTNFLDRTQLATVCERVGLHKIAGKVADEVFEKLDLDSKQKISFSDFIGLIQSDADGLTVPTNRTFSLHMDGTRLSGNSIINIKDTDTTEKDLHVDRDISHKMEMVLASDIIEMWESAGIVHAKNLYRNLGFEDDQISISQLSNALEEELRGLHGEAQTTPLLRASLVLRKAEVIALQQAFTQLIEENKKLHADNRDANRRVALLAQEIDERHATLEKTSKSEIRLLEQRHAEIVRELTSQLASDRENWSNLNSRLENRIKSLEQEEQRFKTDLQTQIDENSALETEQISLQKQITELLESNIKLNNEIVELEDRHRSDDTNQGEKETEEVLELIDKITTLQVENANLRDKNDELAAEVESLSAEISRTKYKKNSSSKTNLDIINNDTVSDDPEHSSMGVKRRGDSPSKIRIADESPRLGKLRKCNNDNSESETSGDWVALNSELGTTLGTSNSVVSNASGFSQDLSSIHDSREDEIKGLKKRISSLEMELKESTSLTASTENHSLSSEHDKTIKEEKDRLESRCQDLELSLEQMRKAYEDCEDYWQGKLQDERQLFEKERQIYEEEQEESDKKFAELMQKVREYEEQFNKEGRLSPIEEKDALEQQYAQLEAETEEIRENARKIFEEKEKEVAALQEQIKDLQQRLGDYDISSTNHLAPDQPGEKNQASSPISYLLSQSTIQSPAHVCQNHNWNRSKTDSNTEPSTISEQTIITTVQLPKTDNDGNIVPNISPIQKPNSSNKLSTADNPKESEDESASTTSGKSLDSHSGISTQSPQKTDTSCCQSPNSIKAELKRLRMVEIQMKEQIKDLAQKRDGLVMELQQLHEAKPVLEKAYARASHPSLLQRVNHLEQKNRHLQTVLKQQQHYTESIMHQTWQQQRSEISELRSRLETQGIIMAEQAQRLANADLLVKDLYVENSHLSASIQRLEQQRSRANLMHQSVSGVPGLP